MKVTVKILKITVKVEGGIKTPNEKIECELDTPDGWDPNFNTVCKVSGAILLIKDKLQKSFTPKPSAN